MCLKLRLSLYVGHMQIDVRVFLERFYFNNAKDLEGGMNVANTRTG